MQTELRPTLLARLRCASCGSTLSNKQAALVCSTCGSTIDVVNGIPRFVAEAADPVARRTQESFGYEWTTFNDWTVSGTTNFEQYFGDIDWSRLRQAVVLDGGCGMGRHARQVAPHVGQLVAVDFSRAIDAAARTVSDCSNVDCVQADLLKLPFADGAFDYVYSLGVIHHIEDTEAALRQLVRVARPGGRVRVYLYWRRHGFAGAVLKLVSAFRHITVRWPHPLLKAFCLALSVVLWIGVVLPYRALHTLGVRRYIRWPLSVYARYPFQVLYNDQFDRFSAPIEKRYDSDDVKALLERAGLRDISVRGEAGWIAEGARP